MSQFDISHANRIARLQPASKGERRQHLESAQRYLERFGYFSESAFEADVLESLHPRRLNLSNAKGSYNLVETSMP